MPHHLTIERFEGDKNDIAILLTDDGDPVQLPRKLLPNEARPGEVLTLHLEPDPAATAKLSKETRAVQHELEQRDPGGDIKL